MHGIQQRHCKRIEPARRVRDQQTGVLVGGSDGRLGGLWGAAYDHQKNRESAAGRGRLQGSATTNGLPPSLALSSGRTATASGRVA
jgi:hypothetical protein